MVVWQQNKKFGKNVTPSARRQLVGTAPPGTAGGMTIPPLCPPSYLPRTHYCVPDWIQTALGVVQTSWWEQGGRGMCRLIERVRRSPVLRGPSAGVMVAA